MASPWGFTCSPGANMVVVVASPLVLLEQDQLDFYRARGRALRSTR